MEIISSTEFKDVFLVFENVTQPSKGRPVVRYDGVTIHLCSYLEDWNVGNGTLKAWVATLPAAIQIASGEFAETSSFKSPSIMVSKAKTDLLKLLEFAAV